MTREELILKNDSLKMIILALAGALIAMTVLLGGLIVVTKDSMDRLRLKDDPTSVKCTRKHTLYKGMAIRDVMGDSLMFFHDKRMAQKVCKFLKDEEARKLKEVK